MFAFNGNSVECKTFIVKININDIIYEKVEVVQSPNPRKNALVGRDLINLWNMRLDGRNHTGEFISV